VAPVFGDIRLERRQFGHLVPEHWAASGFPVPQKRLFAVHTLFGKHLYHLVDSLVRHRFPPMARMPGLSTALPATLLSAAATLALLPGEPVRGRRFRRCHRVSIPQTQLPLKVGNLLFGFHQLLVTVGQLLTKLLNLARLTLVLALQPPHLTRHTGHRTPILVAGGTQLSSLPGFAPKRQT
jgi:hypothetical protein